jgi:preprotein translocase subunit SecA
MFNAMMEAIKEESVGFLFNVEVKLEEPEPAPEPPVLDMSKVLAEAPAGLLEPAPAPVEQAPVEEAPAAEEPAAAVEPVEQVLTPSEPLVEPEVPAAQAPPAPAAPPAPVESAPAPPPPATAKPAITVLPESFGRPDKHPTALEYTAPDLDGSAKTTTAGGAPLDGVSRGSGEQSRNSLCSCGSGKKYKRCHGDPRNQA